MARREFLSTVRRKAFLLTLIGAQVVQVLLERRRALPAGWFDPALGITSALLATVVTAALAWTGVISAREVPPFDYQYFADKWITLGGEIGRAHV